MAKMAFGVQYKTKGSAQAVEDWLDTHCKGAWDIRLGDLDEESGRKTLQIFFERDADKNAFTNAFTKS
jgi:hypothetical protein